MQRFRMKPLINRRAKNETENSVIETAPRIKSLAEIATLRRANLDDLEQR